MSQLIASPPAPAILPAPTIQEEVQSWYWNETLARGLESVYSLLPQIDILCERASQLPARAGLTRPVLGQYLSMVRALAGAWPLHCRPVLQGALENLRATAQCLAAHADPVLAVAAWPASMAAPMAAFEAFGATLHDSLSQLARVANDLEADAQHVRLRLQADQMQMFLLKRQLESSAGDCARANVQGQIAQLHGEQALTRAEADYLDSVRAAVAPCLAAVARLADASGQLVAGLQALAAAQASLGQLLPAQPGTLEQAGAALTTALSQWQGWALATEGQPAGAQAQEARLYSNSAA
ncbi:MAG: hypothetical protein ACJ8GW_08745 [Massilia sp.]